MKLPTVIVLIFLSCIAAGLFWACKPVWQFDHLEQNARKVITAAELQQWATNFLAQYPPDGTNVVGFRTGGTNFPPQLRDLAPKLGPIIFTCPAEGTNSPAWAAIYWGSGFFGAHGF